MAEPPAIKHSGLGSRRQAADIGRTVAAGTASGLAGYAGPPRIDTLRVQVPVGAGKRDIERAIRLAVARKTRGDGA
jgi:hypothetical protein